MVDDQAAFHTKFVTAGNGAIGLWVRAGSWSQAPQNLTEGFIPKQMARTLGTAGQIKKLVEVGLWHEVDGGYQFHEWTQRQMSRQEILDRRRKRSEAGRIGGRRSGESRRGVGDLETVDGEVFSNLFREHDSDTTPVVVEENSVFSSPETLSPAETLENGEASASASAEANAKQKRTPDPVLIENSTYVPTNPPVNERARRPRGGREVADRLNATAHSGKAHMIARKWAASVRKPPPGEFIGEVAQVIDGCLQSGYDEDEILAGIAAWDASPFTLASKIPGFVHQVVNRDSNVVGLHGSNRGASSPQLSNHDRKTLGWAEAAAEVKRSLGITPTNNTPLPSGNDRPLLEILSSDDAYPETA
ncbi:hypothetical protein ACFYY5_29000 [Nocardia elegans]|uniref:Uncharacterized protein n=1 Tax=Nocardia elegans TaxID=300029 RepID=A0ABW6TL84_9NOCA